MMKTVATIWVLIMGFALQVQARDVVLFPDGAKLTPPGVKLERSGVLNWSKAGSKAEWNFQIDEAGEYHVFIELGVIGWAAGAVYEVYVDGQHIVSYKMPNTSASMVKKRMTNEPIQFAAGAHQLLVSPSSQTRPNTMGNFKAVLLTKKERITEMVDSSYYKKGDSFAATLTDLKSKHPELVQIRYLENIEKKLWADFPHQMAWLIQDLVDADEGRRNPKIKAIDTLRAYFADTGRPEEQLIQRVLSEIKQPPAVDADSEASSEKLLSLYETLCMQRRRERLAPLVGKVTSIVFAKHQVFASISGIYNITENEGLNEGEISGLYQVHLDTEKAGQFAQTTRLFDPGKGMVRDPEISYDGKKLLFAWRKTTQHRSNAAHAPDQGNYQIYEMDLATKTLRQLTTDAYYGAAFSPCYLPDGNIMFNSSRIVQQITCGFGDHSNLFLMNADGNYQRRVGFDQVSSEFPTVLNNGQVIQLRRDYNDRGQVGAHALIVMNPDGTGQTEYYGNQTGTPTSFMHARAVPGSPKVACVLSGYHTRQGGQLALIDIRKGRNHGEGIVQIPQMTQPPSSQGRDDGYLKAQVQYSDPYPLSETEFIVSRSDCWARSAGGSGLGEHFALYYMTADNQRELLAYDPTTSCLQPVPVMSRKQPPARPSLTDYRKETGTYYVQNVYIGPAAKGITPGSVKKLRVIELLYKHDTIKSGSAAGPGGGTDTVTPPAHPLALFDAKRIIGTATVHEDGSAMFEAPARTPLYFQLLDDKNRCVQTMRSWTTLMPNERFSCVGCHEDKNDTPVVSSRTIAMTKGIEKLEPFYGEPRGFSFLKEVQPIFDKHCISCHKPDGKADKLQLTYEPTFDSPREGRRWARSYVQLMAARPGPDPSVFKINRGPESWIPRGAALPDEPNRYVQYWGRLRAMAFDPPYFAGAVASGMIKKLEGGHQNVELSQQDWDTLVAWIDLNCPYSGDYMEANIWSPGDVRRYKKRIAERQRNEALEAEEIKAFIQAGQP